MKSFRFQSWAYLNKSKWEVRSGLPPWALMKRQPPVIDHGGERTVVLVLVILCVCLTWERHKQMGLKFSSFQNSHCWSASWYLDTKWLRRWSCWGGGGSLHSTEQSFVFGHWEKQEADVIIQIFSKCQTLVSLPVFSVVQSTKLQGSYRWPGLHRCAPPTGLYQSYRVLQPVIHVAPKEPAHGRKLGQNTLKGSDSISLMKANVRKLWYNSRTRNACRNAYHSLYFIPVLY